MIYLDTHSTIWLLQGKQWLTQAARKLAEQDSLFVSPAVLLEIEMLHERNRLTLSAKEIVALLEQQIQLRVCDLPFPAVARQAADETWTQDPFDRLIVAHARANDAPLLTADKSIHSHYRKALR